MNKQLFLMALLILSGSLLCRAQFPNLPAARADYKFSSSEQLQDKAYPRQIEAFYNNGQEGRLDGKAGIPIYYKVFLQPQNAGAAIMISTGRTEAALKYKELIYDLFHKGYSIYIHDHRGQGLSGRMVEDREMGYVDDFQFYVDDMKAFYEQELKSHMHEKVFLLAHSLGGAIGMLYLEQHPHDFQAAAFSSPMLGLASYICPLAAILSGKNPKYAPGQSGYHASPFEGNDVTGSELRYNLAQDAYEQCPDARLGGASIQWIHRSCKQFGPLFRQIELIETPFILFSASNETVVNPKAHKRFVEKAGKLGKECQAFQVENGQHELLMEKDEQRTAVIAATLNFFTKAR